MNLVYAYPSNLDRTFVRSLQIAQTVNSLAEAGLNVFFIKGPNYSSVSDEDKFRQLGIQMNERLNIITASMLRPEKSKKIRISWNYIGYISILYSILRLNRKIPIDAIYVRDLALAMFLLKKGLLLKSIPIIYEIHDLRGVSMGLPPNRKIQKLVETEQFVIQNSAALVAISPGAVEHIKRLYTTTKTILVAPDGVDLDIFTPVATDQNSKIIAYSGGLYPWKGVDLAIQAMSYVDKNIKLLIIGAQAGDNDTIRLSKLITELHLEKQVEMLPFMPQKELLNIFKKIRAALIPLPADQAISNFFTSPLKLFEYMASCIPIIATNVPSLNWILHDRKNALLVNPNDPKALAQAIHEIISAPGLSQNLTKEAFKDVEKYSWKNRGKRIASLIEKLKVRDKYELSCDFCGE